jgi:deoxyadenosine/deoxycytidine kinase
MYTIHVEGNIGSGKTTLLNYLESWCDRDRVTVVREPVELWRNLRSNDTNLLDSFYLDPQHWSFTFEQYVQLTMFQKHSKLYDCEFRVCERSIHSAYHCFARLLHESGKLIDVEMNILQEYYDWLSGFSALNPDLVIFIDATPEEVHSRISSRGRPEEKNIPISYLRQVDAVHREWVSTLSVPVVTFRALDLNLESPSGLIQLTNLVQEKLPVRDLIS